MLCGRGGSVSQRVGEMLSAEALRVGVCGVRRTRGQELGRVEERRVTMQRETRLW